VWLDRPHCEDLDRLDALFHRPDLCSLILVHPTDSPVPPRSSPTGSKNWPRPSGQPWLKTLHWLSISRGSVASWPN
jgi:hypothetical protein